MNANLDVKKTRSFSGPAHAHLASKFAESANNMLIEMPQTFAKK
jgi:hypothetical protein